MAKQEMRCWYIDCALAFQASETSLSLVRRSKYSMGSVDITVK